MNNINLLELEAELEAARLNLSVMKGQYDAAKAKRAAVLLLEPLADSATSQEKSARTRALNVATREAADAAEGWGSSIDEVTSLEKRVLSTRMRITRAVEEVDLPSLSGSSTMSKAVKLPGLPSFRVAGAKFNEEDPTEFMVKFVDILSANEIPEVRYVNALITCMDLVDREWVRENITTWDHNSKNKFIENFEEKSQKATDIRKLQACKQGHIESAQKYSDKFNTLRKKLKKNG